MRVQEIIKVKGFQVSPNELEGHLLSHPDVADAGVVGVQDDYAGELPVAFVVLKENARQRIAGNAQAEKELKVQLMKVRAMSSHFMGMLILVIVLARL